MMSNYTWEYIQSNQKEATKLLGIDYEQLQELIQYITLLEERDKKEKVQIILSLISG